MEAKNVLFCGDDCNGGAQDDVAAYVRAPGWHRWDERPQVSSQRRPNKACPGRLRGVISLSNATTSLGVDQE